MRGNLGVCRYCDELKKIFFVDVFNVKRRIKICFVSFVVG